ncbi:MAG TPA: GTPase Era [Thermoanaerobaculia bacterium]|nr:GTPase Era [Thermoanaerobaculia bacterium]
MAYSSSFRSGRVAVVGRPNVGKSTLVNRLVGEKVAIVSEKPQTTRKRVLGVARVPGAEIALVDTPGIHRPHFRMNAAMVRDATDALATADVILWLVDASERAGRGEAFLLELIARAGTPAVLALNKIDLVAKERLLPMIADLSTRHSFAAIVPVSAKTGDGVERLARALAESLPEGEPAYPEDFLTSMPETEWIAEVIREKLLERTREELPFASAVVIEAVKEDPKKDLTVVTASVVVEREGQKGIVVGRGGFMIRDIGTAAREELESQTGRRYFLELTVKVRPDWRNDEHFLSRLAVNPGSGTS